jgi:mono/diheme cytochrome c family protein
MGSFRWMIVFGMMLTVAIFLIFDCHSVSHALNRDAGKRGALLFQTKGCERCHSITGVGGDRAPDLGSIGQRRKADRIKAQILHGGNGMPAFKGVLAKDEIEALVRFLTSCRSDTPPGCRQWTSSEPPPQ